MLKPLNIKVDIQRVPWDKFINEIEGKQAFYVDGFYSRPTIDSSIYPWYHSNGSWNTTLWNYKNAEMDKILDAARAARTEAEQKAQLHEVPGARAGGSAGRGPLRDQSRQRRIARTSRDSSRAR